METEKKLLRSKIIDAFKDEFGFIQDKFEILDLLSNNSSMDYDTIEYLKLPSEENNLVWHPGVYMFLGNNLLYKVGVSMVNSRARVMQHLEACTSKNGYCIWDINNYEDKSILLFNVKNRADRHWLLSIEAYFEEIFTPVIRAGRIG